MYPIVRGKGMAERSMRAEQAARAQLDSYIRSAATTAGTPPVDDLTRLAELRNSGTITDAEFEAMKRRVVGGGPAPAV